MTKFIMAFLQACGIVLMLGVVMAIAAVLAMAAGIISAFAWFIGLGVAIVTAILAVIIFIETN